ncbi:MAG: bacterio-opsin activator domain-containing protein, partial [Haloarculaceae archaeon]
EAEGSVVLAHVDITARKLAELETEQRGRELEHLLGRLQGLVVDVMEAVLQATDRPDIERTVCDQLVGVEDYAVAWVGRVDLRREAVLPAASAGVATLPEDAAISLDSDDPVALALDRQQPELCCDRSDLPVHDVHEAVFEGIGAGPGGALAAFPLVYGSTEYGVLALYAPDLDAFDERELALLEILARVASTAINAVEGRRILATDSVVELEVTLRAPGLFFADLSRTLECVLEYEGTLYGTGDTVTMLFVASGVDPEALLDAARGHEEITDARLVSAGEESAVLEVNVAAAPLVDAAAERGAETTALRVEDGLIRATFELPAGAQARAVVEALEERYESVALAARRERERREQTRGELLEAIEEALTDRQRLTLQKAHVGGFFDWPREVSGEDLAASMDISPSTYHQHLRAAERKVLDALFEDWTRSDDEAI